VCQGSVPGPVLATSGGHVCLHPGQCVGRQVSHALPPPLLLRPGVILFTCSALVAEGRLTVGGLVAFSVRSAPHTGRQEGTWRGCVGLLR